MRSLLPSLKRVRYRSSVECDSKTTPGVKFTIRHISLGRRIALAEAIRNLAEEEEFQRAGRTAREQVDAAILSAKIDRIYLDWGLIGLGGFSIDGRPATAGALVDIGPERLLREIIDRIKSECSLADDERKN